MVKATVGFLGMSVVAGVLVTATVTPAVALAGVAANQSIGVFDGLPEYLEVDKLSEKSNIYATRADGSPQLLASFYVENRAEVPLDKMSQFAKDATVAGEDPRFYDHGGIDLPGTLRAVAQTYVLGNDTQGGSSITQQYVKNVLVEKAVRNITDEAERAAAIDAATRTSPERKLREMKLAIGIEKQYTKDQILQGYLNIAFFGGTTYGLETAANYYFNTSAANLSIAQAASLIAIVNNPAALRLDQPDNPDNGAANGYARNKDRRDYIIGKMLEEGKISQEDHDAALATPVEPAITQPSTGCSTAGNAGFFCDYVTNILKNNEIFGADEDTRWSNFRRGGQDVYTTLDVDLQNAAVDAVNAQVPQTWNFDVGAVSVSVEVGTGRVLAMTQNKNYSQDPDVLTSDPSYSAINLNTDKAYGGSSGIQPGSTYKLFTLVEWLKEGHSINESVDGTRKAIWGTFRDSCVDGGTVYEGSTSAKNDEGGSGQIGTAVDFTRTSLNTGFVGMARELDLCAIRDTAVTMGVQQGSGLELEHNPSSVLGTNSVSPLSMAGAFATIASGGTTCDPVAIDRITDATGAEQPIPSANCRQSIDRNVAATAAIALQSTFSGSGTAYESRTGDGIPLIGKTGTTDDAKATWMTGASTKVATAVGVFNIQGDANLRLGRYSFDSGSAATARHRIWPVVMRAADSRYGGDAFPEANGSLQVVPKVDIPNVTGLALADAKAKLEAAGFTFAQGASEASDTPAGTVTRSDPSGSAVSGSIVTVFASSGPQPKATEQPNPAGQTKVPDVTGQNLEAAKAAFSAAGFTAITLQCTADDKAPADGRVTGQDPAGGASVAPTATLKVAIAAKKCP
ncbi:MULTISPECIES: transglycosylase domain-containing protein [unclassified Rathayibacter]|uniref:transglycosylase domain-containing protein n=1 Tax=unclassified Rathayibacter TaxID=2609250 RepID=UPI00188CEAE4|nr:MULTISPECIES: transglycosylase domain-containing protein [unclassified Rathayibacter]MBF4504336.1 transglycosylase domain-containing protein [Rathayibacter sp. VKM Ac-2878]